MIFSKDRAAQLDLLLRSLNLNGMKQFDPFVLSAELAFEPYVRWALADAGAFICFMCDDGIVYRPVLPVREQTWDERLLCWSLRLGRNTTVCYPSGLSQEVPVDFPVWRWVFEPRAPGSSDFGYPGSLDGHVFRTADVARMLEEKSFPNPTALECALVLGCDELAQERPLMGAFPQSVYVGNPVNRVSEQSNVRYGTRYPMTAEECKRRFDAGERIDLYALDFSGVNGAHTEIELKWTSSR